MARQWDEVDDDRLIHQLYQTMREFSKTRNQAIWGYDVYGSEWMTMNMIRHRGECSQSELIAYFGVEPPAISKELTQLEKKGIIVRELKPGSRGKFIRLTDKGQQIYEQMSGVVARHRQQALMVLTISERRQLETMMRKLYRNLLSENDES